MNNENDTAGSVKTEGTESTGTESTEVTKITGEQHPNFIWTWKSNDSTSKAGLWIPYFSKAVKSPDKETSWLITYRGGTLEADLKKADLIMFYEASGDLPMELLYEASQRGIILIVYRDSEDTPCFFYPQFSEDPKDIVTDQILTRCHAQKRVYAARVLVRERLQKMRARVPMPTSVFSKLDAAGTVAEVRNIEAVACAKYWCAWFNALGIKAGRKTKHPVNTALDAGTKFLYGVMLRWIILHNLSPNHGFLNVQTDRPSLAYDLAEPYLYLVEDSVFSVWSEAKEPLSEKDAVAQTLARLKALLHETCFVPATRQCVRKKNLLHGVVLALRAYILGDMKKFVIPVEGVPNGGRPPAVSYKLPGTLYNVDLRKFRVDKNEVSGDEADPEDA
jgi:CRISPR/Cas system-associated endonuclease Cas1